MLLAKTNAHAQLCLQMTDCLHLQQQFFVLIDYLCMQITDWNDKEGRVQTWTCTFLNFFVIN